MSNLRKLKMPTATPELEAEQLASMGEIDPSTGLPMQEEGLEEGDIVMDYVMPIKNLFTGGLKAAAGGGIKALKALMPRGRQGGKGSGGSRDTEPAKLDYSKINKQTGPGNTTDATTGFKATKGVRIES